MGYADFACNDAANDPLTWIDDQDDFRLVGLSGVDKWEQISPTLWRFYLRSGVTFHNGASWDATQAKFWIDYFGDARTRGHDSPGFLYHGAIRGEVVDDYVLDVICEEACPILPRHTVYTRFQDVGWFKDASTSEVDRNTVGLGPYRIVEWNRGRHIIEAFEDYNPNPATVYAQRPAIQVITQVWRNDPGVRAAMIQVGEADWAEDIPPNYKSRLPHFVSKTTHEVFNFPIDTVHDPELRKVEVREALNISVDCQTVLQRIFDDLVDCYANIAPGGTVGIINRNSAPHPYQPERARQLLQEADYDPNHKIVLTMRSDRLATELEYGEALVDSWREVGINAELNLVPFDRYIATISSNCGSGRTRADFARTAGGDLHEKCRNLGPGDPNNVSMQITGGLTSGISLDYAWQATQLNSCYSPISGVCYEDLEALIWTAFDTPMGDPRRQRMEAIADRVYDNFHFVQGFQAVTVFGLDLDLRWEPYYAPRLRVNTMHFRPRSRR